MSTSARILRATISRSVHQDFARRVLGRTAFGTARKASFLGHHRCTDVKKATFRTSALLVLPISVIVLAGVGRNPLRHFVEQVFPPISISGVEYCYPEPTDHKRISGNIAIYASTSTFWWWENGANVKLLKQVALTSNAKRYNVRDRLGEVYYRPESYSYIIHTSMASVPNLKSNETIVGIESAIHVAGGGEFKFSIPVQLEACA